MTETKKILNIALPAMAENLLQMLMGIVDSYLVAQVGIVAISGVSVANNIITIYQAIFIALGASSASVIILSFILIKIGLISQLLFFSYTPR